MSSDAALVLTIGTGNKERLEESLYTPLTKSIKDGEWREIVLLPSQATEEGAEVLRQRFPDLRINTYSLPNPNMENNADACFAHFNDVLGKLLREYKREEIVIDFTRGTKGMSAALVLAAVRHNIPQMRYIGGPRDEHGAVIAGKEEIATLNAVQATGRRLLDDARHLLRQGDFAAIPKLLSDFSNLPEGLRREGAMLLERAEFYGAWDRLAYREATKLGKAFAKDSALHDAVDWTRKLADVPERSNHSDMSRWLKKIACDLLENGRRRVRDQQFEDALLRAYRVLELIGQFRLFCRGYDTASIDPEDNLVKELEGRLKKKKSHGFGENGKGRYTAARTTAARFLEHIGDPLGRQLFDFGEKTYGALTATRRNHSILVHGFEAAAAKADESSLVQVYDDLQKLLCGADEEAKSRLDKIRRCYTDIDAQCRVSM